MGDAMVLVGGALQLTYVGNKSARITERPLMNKTMRPWDRISKVSKSLSRTLSLPRRCRICGKIVYFRSFRCRVCNSVSHRQCIDHTDQLNNSVLQPNKADIHSETERDSIHSCGLNRTRLATLNKECVYRRESIPTNGIGHRLHDDSCNHQLQVMGLQTPNSLRRTDIAPSLMTARTTCTTVSRATNSNNSGNNSGSGFYRRLVCWLRSRKSSQHDGDTCHSSGNHEHALCEKYMKGKYGCKNSESQLVRKRLKLVLSGDSKGWPMQWQHQDRCKRELPMVAGLQRHCQSPRCSCIQRDSGISSLSSSVAQTPSCDCDNRVVADHQLTTPSASSNCFPSRTRCSHSKPSSGTIRDPLAIPHAQNVHHQMARQSVCCNGMPYQHYPVHASVPTECFRAELLKEKSNANMAHTVHLFCGQLDEGRFGRRCPSKTRTLSLESRNGPREDMCATWPPVGRKIFTTNDDAFEGSESGFEDYDNDDDFNSVCHQSHSNEKDSLGEWSIPFKDLKFGRQLRRGRRHDIYRGRWHGEVMIHIFHINSEQETSQFWKEVTSLSMIRHENVALFMGVCIDMPQLAIVTSIRKGSSLYDHVHVKKDHFPLPYKVHIARQVAQGMSYLHAKGIIHRKLNSKNILLETKAKVSLLDQGMAEKDLDREDYGCVPNGHLTYVSPEIMRSLRVEPPKIVPMVPYTKYSDVFAFGTLLYELFGEQWPFQGQRAHAVIWQVGSGNLQSLDGLKCSAGIKNLVSECWSSDLTCRPNFHHILKTLQQNVLLQRRHSTSEPDNLNRLGFVQGLLPC